MSGDWHDMSDAEWEILRPVLPRKHDRRVMTASSSCFAPARPVHDLLQPVERERHLGVDHVEASRACRR